METLCRNFLWDGGTEFMRSPLVSWDKVCKPVKEGGLGLKNNAHSNKAAIAKFVWWITSKSDHLWVKWVNIYYQQQQLSNQKGHEYSIFKGYECLREKGAIVPWHGCVWNKWNIPKHSLMAWMYYHNSLNTNEKLKRLGIAEDDTCYLCGIECESQDHLFFNCCYSKKILENVEQQIKVKLSTQNILAWLQQKKGTIKKQGIVTAIVTACLYQIWRQRNQSKFELHLTKPEIVARQMMGDLRIRIQ
ncbi:uncharacterized protein LOC141630403 [Silene latifolia]|uniref:uncharacterized protein LOC141630403 n=1 Tax=Silene latifolia TaxID=37657 RepID=UPI003D76F28A